MKVTVSDDGTGKNGISSGSTEDAGRTGHDSSEAADTVNIAESCAETGMISCTETGMISCTPGHRFYVDGIGFVRAEDLQSGDILVTSDGKHVTVEAVEADESVTAETPAMVYNFEIEDWHTYFVGEECVLVHNKCPKVKTDGGVPVSEKRTASNGLDYQSNTKHTPGRSGNRQNAGIEPSNSFELFEKSIVSSKSSSSTNRYAYDEATGTLHRFFSDNNGAWHWSGSTNQGTNSLPSNEIPADILRAFNIKAKGW